MEPRSAQHPQEGRGSTESLSQEHPGEENEAKGK